MQPQTAFNAAPASSPVSGSAFEETFLNMLNLGLEALSAGQRLLERSGPPATITATVDDLSEAAEVCRDVLSPWFVDPMKFWEAQASLFGSYAGLWCNSALKAFGEETGPVAEPDAGDSRFKDPEWSSNPYYDFVKQSYLIAARWSETFLAETEGLDPQTRRKAEFYTRLITAALSPSNFACTNPEVMRETLASNGRNLVRGMRQFVEDIERSGDVLTISQTDTSAFEVGRNLATTPGKVVFENEIFQLIQYAPATEKVREVPLLVVPPWINKFYILDLTQEKSFVRYAVGQGFTVFLVSWVNPDARLAHKTFEDYVTEGLLTAADAVKRETGTEKCNVLGYCIGGTLTGSALAYTAARNEDRFASATFLTTQFDFSVAGDLTLFTSEAHLAHIEELMRARGYLDSSRLAAVFNMMRSRDLVWPYVVNNYLLGKKPAAFDVLYWNQDSTRMPAANHRFYLRAFYGENRLAKGELALNPVGGWGAPERSARAPAPATVSATPEDHILFYLRSLRSGEMPQETDQKQEGIRLNLRKVSLPIYELATREDHIAPAPSVFRGSRLFSSPVEFVLAGSGHIAGVINPPGKKVKYQYWTGPLAAEESYESWFAKAKETPGSWWPHWAEWLARHSGDWTGPRPPGAVLGTIEDAPGRYVKCKTAA